MAVAVLDWAFAGPGGAEPTIRHNHDVAPKDRFDAYLQHLAMIDTVWGRGPMWCALTSS